MDFLTQWLNGSLPVAPSGYRPRINIGAGQIVLPTYNDIPSSDRLLAGLYGGNPETQQRNTVNWQSPFTDAGQQTLENYLRANPDQAPYFKPGSPQYQAFLRQFGHGAHNLGRTRNMVQVINPWMKPEWGRALGLGEGGGIDPGKFSQERELYLNQGGDWLSRMTTPTRRVLGELQLPSGLTYNPLFGTVGKGNRFTRALGPDGITALRAAGMPFGDVDMELANRLYPQDRGINPLSPREIAQMAAQGTALGMADLNAIHHGWGLAQYDADLDRLGSVWKDGARDFNSSDSTQYRAKEGLRPMAEAIIRLSEGMRRSDPRAPSMTESQALNVAAQMIYNTYDTDGVIADRRLRSVLSLKDNRQTHTEFPSLRVYGDDWQFMESVLREMRQPSIDPAQLGQTASANALSAIRDRGGPIIDYEALATGRLTDGDKRRLLTSVTDFVNAGSQGVGISPYATGHQTPFDIGPLWAAKAGASGLGSVATKLMEQDFNSRLAGNAALTPSDYGKIDAMYRRMDAVQRMGFDPPIKNANVDFFGNTIISSTGEPIGQRPETLVSEEPGWNYRLATPNQEYTGFNEDDAALAGMVKANPNEAVYQGLGGNFDYDALMNLGEARAQAGTDNRLTDFYGGIPVNEIGIDRRYLDVTKAPVRTDTVVGKAAGIVPGPWSQVRPGTLVGGQAIEPGWQPLVPSSLSSPEGYLYSPLRLATQPVTTEQRMGKYTPQGDRVELPPWYLGDRVTGNVRPETLLPAEKRWFYNPDNPNMPPRIEPGEPDYRWKPTPTQLYVSPQDIPDWVGLDYGNHPFLLPGHRRKVSDETLTNWSNYYQGLQQADQINATQQWEQGEVARQLRAIETANPGYLTGRFRQDFQENEAEALRRLNQVYPGGLAYEGFLQLPNIGAMSPYAKKVFGDEVRLGQAVREAYDSGRINTSGEDFNPTDQERRLVQNDPALRDMIKQPYFNEPPGQGDIYTLYTGDPDGNRIVGGKAGLQVADDAIKTYGSFRNLIDALDLKPGQRQVSQEFLVPLERSVTGKGNPPSRKLVKRGQKPETIRETGYLTASVIPGVASQEEDYRDLRTPQEVLDEYWITKNPDAELYRKLQPNIPALAGWETQAGAILQRRIMKAIHEGSAKRLQDFSYPLLFAGDLPRNSYTERQPMVGETSRQPWTSGPTGLTDISYPGLGRSLTPGIIRGEDSGVAGLTYREVKTPDLQWNRFATEANQEPIIIPGKPSFVHDWRYPAETPVRQGGKLILPGPSTPPDQLTGQGQSYAVGPGTYARAGQPFLNFDVMDKGVNTMHPFDEIKQYRERINAIQRTPRGVEGGMTQAPINVWAGSGDNAQFSNFSNRPFTINIAGQNRSFQSPEHYYQAMKALEAGNRDLANQIKNSPDGFTAKKLGSQVQLTPEQDAAWKSKNVDVLLQGMRASFNQNPDAAQQLLATGNTPFTHSRPGASSQDFWSVKFPELLSTVRSELSSTQAQTPAIVAPTQVIQHASPLGQYPSVGRDAYAGIGSETTPSDVQQLMTRLAGTLEDQGLILRSGGARGADRAFQQGVRNPANMEIWLPNNRPYYGLQAGNPGLFDYRQAPGYQGARQMAEKFNPSKDYIHDLYAYNAMQVLGPDLNSPSKLIYAWTPGGREVGGTRFALDYAKGRGIPVRNLGNPMVRQEIEKQLGIAKPINLPQTQTPAIVAPTLNQVLQYATPVAPRRIQLPMNYSYGDFARPDVAQFLQQSNRPLTTMGAVDAGLRTGTTRIGLPPGLTAGDLISITGGGLPAVSARVDAILNPGQFNPATRAWSLREGWQPNPGGKIGEQVFSPNAKQVIWTPTDRPTIVRGINSPVDYAKAQTYGNQNIALGFTANSMRNQGGALVMGAGNAQQAALANPSAPIRFGAALRDQGTPIGGDFGLIEDPSSNFVAIQTKRDWRNSTPMDLLENVTLPAVQQWSRNNPGRLLITPPWGIGQGGANPDQVAELMSRLPANVMVADPGNTPAFRRNPRFYFI